MSYEKNEWQTGDVITATKLNHMEDGIADGGGGGGTIMHVYVVHNVTNNQYVVEDCDMAYADVVTAFQSGSPVTAYVSLRHGTPDEETKTYTDMMSIPLQEYLSAAPIPHVDGELIQTSSGNKLVTVNQLNYAQGEQKPYFFYHTKNFA